MCLETKGTRALICPALSTLHSVGDWSVVTRSWIKFSVIGGNWFTKLQLGAKLNLGRVLGAEAMSSVA